MRPVENTPRFMISIGRGTDYGKYRDPESQAVRDGNFYDYDKGTIGVYLGENDSGYKIKVGNIIYLSVCRDNWRQYETCT